MLWEKTGERNYKNMSTEQEKICRKTKKKWIEYIKEYTGLQITEAVGITTDRCQWHTCNVVRSHV